MIFISWLVANIGMIFRFIVFAILEICLFALDLPWTCGRCDKNSRSALIYNLRDVTAGSAAELNFGTNVFFQTLDR